MLIKVTGKENKIRRTKPKFLSCQVFSGHLHVYNSLFLLNYTIREDRQFPCWFIRMNSSRKGICWLRKKMGKKLNIINLGLFKSK